MPRTILIVDDMSVNREIIKKLLGGEYDVLEADDGRLALEMMEREYERLSAVLLDLSMPVMDGYAVLEAMRGSERLSRLPVIVLTGSSDTESEERALRLGAMDFVSKPYQPAIIRQRLKNTINLRETAAEVNTLQTDRLTGVWNRETFFRKAAEQIAAQDAGYYILACVDIDNFKVINDQYGSPMGDRVLASLGSALLRSCQKLNTLCGRIFADCFICLYPRQLLDDGQIGPEPLAEAILRDTGMKPSLSVGRYIVEDKSLSVSAMYDRAALAQSTVKQRYGGHVAVYDESMRSHLVGEQQLVNDMNAALAGGQFEVWYQPQYNHATGAIIGAEALVRWRHPQRGLVPPAAFIPVFERNGFIYEMDKYVWERVCADLRGWLDEGRSPLPVSVNISRHDVFCADLIPVLTGLLEKYALPVALLRLEVTESAFVQSTEQIVTVVKRLVELGFTVEIDDFGSGYSSLNTLKDVPAQILKLDMRFLEAGADNERSGSIIESVVRMAKWLGMSVIAEGVETLQQADYLRSIGCSYMQGYLFARPMPKAEYEAMCCGAGKEERLLTLETVETLDNASFWDPASMDTLIFNSYVSAACIMEFHNGKMEMLRVSEKYVQLVGGGGLTAESALAIDWARHMGEGGAQQLTELLQKAVDTKKEVSDERVFLDLPGCPAETWLRSSLRVIASAGDRYLFYCITEDITAQRSAERAIRESTRQLQRMMDDIPGGYARMRLCENGGLKTDYINAGLTRLLGFDHEELVAIYADDAMRGVHPDDLPVVSEVVERMLENGEAHSYRYRLMHKNGDYIWVKIFGRVSRDGDARYLNIYYTDVTETVKNEERQRELLDNLPCGAALYEFAGGVLSALHINKRYWELVDRGEVRYLQADFLNAVHPDDRAVIHRELAAAIREERDFVSNVRVLYGRDEYRLFHVVGHIVKTGEESFTIYASYDPVSDESLYVQEMLPVALQAVMSASDDVSFVKGRDGRYICASRKFAALAGYTDERGLTGRSAADVFPPKYAAGHAADDDAVLTEGRSFVNYGVQLPTENGVRYLVFSKYPLLDAAGNVLGVFGTGRDMTEARETESRLELLTNNIPGGIATYEGDPEHLDKIRLTYFSDGFCRLFGYSREEYQKLAEVNPLGLVYTADVSKMYERILALVREDVPLDFSYRALSGTGDVKWINVRAAMGEPNDGRLTVNAVFLDVTEEKKALERLRMSEEINRLAIEQGRSVVCRYDVAAKTLFVPSDDDPIFGGAPVEEDVPDSMVRAGKVSPETADAYLAFYADIQKGEKTGQVLFQKNSTEGWRWMEAHSTTIFSDSGEPVTAVISYADVTENIEKDAAYKKWVQSLREKEPGSYSLYHCSVTKDAVLEDAEGELIPEAIYNGVTRMSERTENYARQRVVPEDRERFLDTLERQTLLARYARGKRRALLEYRELLPGGGARWLRLTVDLVDMPVQAEVGAYLLFEDVDEQKRAELEILERAQTDPLTGLYNRGTFAQRVNDYIAQARPGARHALLMLDIDGFKLVNDIFGHGAGDQALIDVAELLRGGSRQDDLVGRLGGDEFVIFLSDIHGEAAAAKKAQQICELTRKTFSLEVQISGSIGIALYPQDGDSFESLYKKADETLYYVKDTGKNKYAFYRRELTQQRLPVPAQNGPAAESVRTRAKRRMLIVDDNKADCELLANMFKDDFRIEKASDGASALIKLHHYGSAISIVLLDLMMPGVDGFMVLERMQLSADTKSIPVIVVSVAEDRETSLRAIRAGASDLVAKPVDPDILRIRVQSAVSKAENERLRAQNSFLELQSSEMDSYRAVLERMDTFLMVNDWVKNTFLYSPSVSKYIAGEFDSRSLWRVLLSDMVADSSTVKGMQRLIHDLANDRSRTEGGMTVILRAVTGEKRPYELRVYKQVNEFGLTAQLILAFRETKTPPDA